MLEISSQPSEEPTWTLEFLNAKIVGGGATWHSPARSKKLSMSNVTAHTNQNTTENSAGVAKPTPRPTHQGWKPRKANLALICSSVRIAVAIIKQKPTCVHSGDTDLTGSGTKRNMLRSVLIDSSPSVLKWTTPLLYEYQKSQDFYAKCSKEFSHRQYYPQNVDSLRHHFNPRTPLVWNTKDSQHFKLRRGSSHRVYSSPQLDLDCQNSIMRQRFSQGHLLYQHSSLIFLFPSPQRYY